MQRHFMLPWIREAVVQSLNSYVELSEILGQIEGYIVSPQLGEQSGVLGALALAQQASVPA